MLNEKPFPDLDGLFDEPKPESEPVQLDPQFLETEYLTGILAGHSGHQEEDVVAVAFGNDNLLHNGKLTHVYLTARGIKESTDPVLAPKYDSLGEMVSHPDIGTETLADALANGAMQSIMSKHEDIIPEHRVLGGEGGERVLLLYVKDTTADTYASEQ